MSSVRGRESSGNTPVEHYLAEFGAVERALPGSGLSWLRQIRKGALARFEQMGFPTPRQEDWKYTRVTPIEKRAFRSALKSRVELQPADIATYRLAALGAHQVVFVNGRYSPRLSEPGDLPKGVTVRSMAEALERIPAEVERHLNRYVEVDASAFTALNTAFMEDGVYVHVAPGVDASQPIHLLFVHTPDEEELCTHPRNLIVCEEHARALVIETYAGLGDARYFCNPVTEAALAPSADLEHYKLGREGLQGFHVSTLQVHQARASRFASHSVSFGGSLVRNDINVRLDDEGTDCLLNGLYMVGGRQHVDYHTRVDHARPHGSSREYYKGILTGRARGVFNGRVYVHPDAQKTDAEQHNANLLLSRDAEVDTKPQLEIYADDVKCSHGATVGQLDENMVFYLRSRGVEESLARALLTYGFARDVVDRMSLSAVRSGLEDLLVSRLPESEYVRGLVHE